MSLVKFFGLPRTCTNVTEMLFASNFKCTVLNNFPCWKHGENTIEGRSLHTTDGRGRKIDTDELIYVVCTKNPYDWLWSLYSFELKNIRRKKSIDDFLLSPCWHYSSERAHSGEWKLDFSKPIDVFNYLTKHWLTMCPEGTIQVKHEDILTPTGQYNLVENVHKRFRIERKTDNWIIKEKRINPRRRETDQKYKKPVSKFTDEHIAFISKHLSIKTMKIAGYEVI